MCCAPPLNPSAPAQAKKIARGDCPVAMPPNRSIEWTFYEKLSFYGLFCGPQICQKCIGGRGSAPDPAGGAHDATPDTLVGWGGVTPFPFPSPSSPRFSRLRRFDFRAPSPWKPGAPAVLQLATVLTFSNSQQHEQQRNDFFLPTEATTYALPRRFAHKTVR